MRSTHRWPRDALGATALVVAVIALGLVLEHTAGPSWAGGGGSKVPTVVHHIGRSHPSSQRIPIAVRKQLLQQRRRGGRYGGADFSNLRGLRKAIVVQLGISAIVIAMMLVWRRVRRRLPRARIRSQSADT
jgi:hypothetical protein